MREIAQNEDNGTPSEKGDGETDERVIDPETIRDGKAKIVTDYYNMRQTNRWEAHVTTDKVIYRPNDVVFAEVLVLDSFTKMPIGLTELEQYLDTLEVLLEVCRP